MTREQRRARRDLLAPRRHTKTVKTQRAARCKWSGRPYRVTTEGSLLGVFATQTSAVNAAKHELARRLSDAETPANA